MFAFLAIFGSAVAAVLAIQAADIDCDSGRDVNLPVSGRFTGFVAGSR